MVKKFVLGLVLLGCLLPTNLFAQEANPTDVLEVDPAFAESLPPDEFAWAKVLEVTETGSNDVEGTKLPFQRLKVQITSGPSNGQTLEIEHGTTFSIRESQILDAGDRFMIGKSYKIDGSSFYFVADRLRIPILGLLAVLFVGLVWVVTGKRGLSAFAGLALSIAVLMLFVVPQILAGANPLLISLVGASVIAFLSIYLAHGFSRQTSLALLSTFLTLVIASLLALLVVTLMQLSGSGSEQAYLLQLGRSDSLDLRGLLLGGIIIGVLGVLDDVTTAQTAAVAELRHANPAFSPLELYKRGFRIGREHILSLVNTLVLAYAGASLPIFLFFELNTAVPWWVILNGEFIAEEIARTLVGSVALILAVPIATAVAAYALGESRKSNG